MSRLLSLLGFLWDFVIGDDWRVALAVAVALAGTLVFSNRGVAIWWLLPLVVVAMLSVSVWQIARAARMRSGDAQ